MDSQNIRIRLKAFDHRILDQSAHEILNCKENWRPGEGPSSYPFEIRKVYGVEVASHW